jgi:hypothetical protein
MTFTVISDPTVALINPPTDEPGYGTTAYGTKPGTTTYQACATDANYGGCLFFAWDNKFYESGRVASDLEQ